MVVLLGTAFYVGTQTNKEVEYVETVIDLRESERLFIAQNAILNYITLDSAWALAESFSSDHWTYYDSTRWSFKDSINIKDSIVVHFIPVIEGGDTVVTFDETEEGIRVQLSLAIKPRYFPTYNKFLTETQLQELTLTQRVEEDSFWKHRWVVYLGYGIGYSFQAGERDHYNNGYQTYAHDHEGWYHGFQLGIGFRLY